MTYVVKIYKGSKYTLWNVTTISLTPQGLTAEHSDRIPTRIQGMIEYCKRVDLNVESDS